MRTILFLLVTAGAVRPSSHRTKSMRQRMLSAERDIGTVIKKRPDNTISKTFLDFGPNGGGVPRRQSYNIEKESLQRLAKHKNECDINRNHFPELQHFDDAKMELVFSNIGLVINHKNWNPFHRVDQDKDFCISQPLTPASIRQQSECISKILLAADVRHLDVFERNIAYGQDGTIGLIDFDIAVLDGKGVLGGNCLSVYHDKRQSCSLEEYGKLVAVQIEKTVNGTVKELEKNYYCQNIQKKSKIQRVIKPKTKKQMITVHKHQQQKPGMRTMLNGFLAKYL